MSGRDVIGRGRPPREMDSLGVPIVKICPKCGSYAYARSHPFSGKSRILRANYCNHCTWKNPALQKMEAAE
jgi:hypothetical protein